MTRTYYILYLAIILLTSCKKYLDVGSPDTQLTGETLFNSDATATAALLSIYSQMESSGLAYQSFLIFGTASDEAVNYRTAADAVAISNNNITPDNGPVTNMWSNYYSYIYQANAIIRGIEKSSNITPAIKNYLLGESYFIRAWCHFYLLQYFGNIPFNTSTDYRVNLAQVQEDANGIYPKIIADLTTSSNLVSSHYLSATNNITTERVRVNKAAVMALLAKVYLNAGNWAKAEEAANYVLAQSSYSLTSNLNNVFLKNSSEAIWQLQANIAGFNSYAGGTIQPTSSTPTVISLTKNLIDSFSAGDQRKINWVKTTTVGANTYYWWYKYKVGQNAPSITEYTMMIRLADIILIRSEARMELDKLSDGLADLNVIRLRAGLAALSTLTKEQLRDAIYKERRCELFGEFSDRWIDLKRSGKINTILGNIKGSNWVSTDQLFPIPLIEMLRHPGMQQNPGY